MSRFRRKRHAEPAKLFCVDELSVSSEALALALEERAVVTHSGPVFTSYIVDEARCAPFMGGPLVWKHQLGTLRVYADGDGTVAWFDDFLASLEAPSELMTA